MSDTVIKFIPTNPVFVPKIKAINEAEELIKSIISDYDDLKILITDEIRFIDQGANFESIFCPLCKSEISSDWWAEAMSEASDHQFTMLQVTVPCCNNKTSLNELKYNWNAGFARFSIEILNPGSEELRINIKKLEDILLCSIKKVAANY